MLPRSFSIESKPRLPTSGRRQSPYALASRISYFLTGSMPDEELLAAAEDESLLDEVIVEAQVRRLLQTDRARARVREFHDQWLGLARLDSIARDGVQGTFYDSLRESLHRYLDRVFWSDESSLLMLYSSSRLDVNAELSALYAPADDAPSEGDGWSTLDRPDERHGLLTHPTLLSLFAHPDQSAPVKRGVFVREAILCDDVAAPPPTVNNIPPDPDPNLTTRERFAVHTEDAVCAECHALIDPIGFGFEAYDQLGRYRTEENSIPVDASGALLGFKEESLNGPLDGAGEMSTMIAESRTALSCLAENWLTFALGRGITEGDRADIERAVDHSVDFGSSLQELVVALCKSDVFLTRAPHDLDGREN